MLLSGGCCCCLAASLRVRGVVVRVCVGERGGVVNVFEPWAPAIGRRRLLASVQLWSGSCALRASQSDPLPFASPASEWLSFASPVSTKPLSLTPRLLSFASPASLAQLRSCASAQLRFYGASHPCEPIGELQSCIGLHRMDQGVSELHYMCQLESWPCSNPSP